MTAASLHLPAEISSTHSVCCSCSPSLSLGLQTCMLSLCLQEQPWTQSLVWGIRNILESWCGINNLTDILTFNLCSEWWQHLRLWFHGQFKVLDCLVFLEENCTSAFQVWVHFQPVCKHTHTHTIAAAEVTYFSRIRILPVLEFHTGCKGGLVSTTPHLHHPGSGPLNSILVEL